MKELIERLEKATGRDRALDADIAAICHPTDDPREAAMANGRDYPDEYTASIEAALTLAPQGSQWSICSHENGRFYAECGADGWQSTGLTAAIALCLAALKARAVHI